MSRNAGDEIFAWANYLWKIVISAKSSPEHFVLLRSPSSTNEGVGLFSLEEESRIDTSFKKRDKLLGK